MLPVSPAPTVSACTFCRDQVSKWRCGSGGSDGAVRDGPRDGAIEAGEAGIDPESCTPDVGPTVSGRARGRRVEWLEQARRVVLPEPDVEREECRDLKAVRLTGRHEHLAEERRHGGSMLLDPGSLEDDVFKRHQMAITVCVGRVDERLRLRHIDVRV